MKIASAQKGFGNDNALEVSSKCVYNKELYIITYIMLNHSIVLVRKIKAPRSLETS